MRRGRIALAMAGVLSLMIGLAGTSSLAAQGTAESYHATLTAVNAGTGGFDAHGTVDITIDGDNLTSKTTVEGVSPNMMHMQHIHGFTEGTDRAQCPTAAADTNGDGIVDLKETEPLAGVTLIPFNDDPVSLDITNASYPTANADGSFTYAKTVSLKALEASFEKAHPGQQLNLDQRVVFVHGVPDDTKLPDTVASLPDVPAQMTLPIACGQLEKGGEAATPVTSPVASPAATPVS